jgi:hypothetical protein
MATFGIVVWRTVKPDAGEKLVEFRANFDFTVSPGLGGTTTTDNTLPTNPAVVTVLKNGVSIGTATFNADGTVNLAGAGGAFLAGTDIFSMTAPGIQDTTFNNFSVNVLATRTS